MPSQSVVSQPSRNAISTAHHVAAPANQAESLTALTLAALGLVALWTLGGVLVVQGLVSRQTDDAHVIRLAERQTMLSERLGTAAVNLATLPESKRQAQTRDFDDAVTALTHTQAGMQHGDASLALPRSIDPRLAQTIKAVAPVFNELLGSAHQIQRLAHRQVPDASSDPATAARKILAAGRDYEAGMETVATEAEHEAGGHVLAVRWASLLFSIGAVGILALEWLFLLGPMLSRVRAQMAQAPALEARIAEQDAKLRAQHAELSAHQNDLAAQQAALADANHSLSEAAAQIRQADGQFQELFHRLPVACYTFDAYGRVAEWNPSCETLYQRPAAEALQQPLWEIITPPHEWDTFREMLTAVLQGTSSEREWNQVRPDGTRVPVLSSAFPVRGANGRISGGISANVDISPQRQQEAQLQEQTTTLTQQREALEQANARLHTLAMEDGVTGLKNHRAFHEGLTREFARVMDSGCREALSVVLMDVDAFKQYNENFGHAAGDDVLRRIAQILLRSARGTDLVARYGGEEFAVVLGQTDRRGAQAYAERVRASVAAANWSFQAVTASLGVTTLRVDTPTAAALMAEADAALCRAKAAGRNRVTFADDPTAPVPAAADPVTAPMSADKAVAA